MTPQKKEKKKIAKAAYLFSFIWDIGLTLISVFWGNIKERSKMRKIPLWF